MVFYLKKYRTSVEMLPPSTNIEPSLTALSIRAKEMPDNDVDRSSLYPSILLRILAISSRPEAVLKKEAAASCRAFRLFVELARIVAKNKIIK